MTDDDTKFERAQRERPHIEAFARLIPNPQPEPEPQPRRGLPRRSWEEKLEDWSRYDREHPGP